MKVLDIQDRGRSQPSKASLVVGIGHPRLFVTSKVLLMVYIGLMDGLGALRNRHHS